MLIDSKLNRIYIGMTTLLVIFFCLEIIGAQDISSDSNTRLIMVFVLSRHGDRSPMHTFKNDPFIDYWVHGSGQLTPVGAEQHYNLGKFLRLRYKSTIPEAYHRDEIEIVSSATERTLMSAHNFVHGLYAHDKWSSTFRIPPIFSRAIEDDYLLKMSVKCPSYSLLYQEMLNSESVRGKIMEYTDFFKILSRATGEQFDESPTSVRNLNKAWKICDAVTIWVDHNLPNYPEWVTKDCYRHCSDLLDYKQAMRFSTPSLTYYRGGPLGAFVIKMFRKRIKDESDAQKTDLLGSKRLRKLAAYFAHDSTLAAIMSYFGIFNGIRPPLASSLIMELHQSNDAVGGSDVFVRFLYRNETQPGSRRLWHLWPPACGSLETARQTNYLCPLSVLENSISGTYSTNVSRECYLGSSNAEMVQDQTCYYPHLLTMVLIQIAFVFFILSRFTTLSFMRILTFFKLRS